MVRAVICAAALFAAVEGRCSCDATPALASARRIPAPVLAANASASPSPISAVDTVAQQNEDWSKTMKQFLEAAAKMAGELSAGKLPSEDELLKSVGALVVEAIGMENPILGGLASFIFSFFQGLFGSQTNQYRALYDMIMNQVKNMIHESEIKTKMNSVKDSIEGYIGEASYLDRTGQQPKADYFYQNMPAVLDSQCLAKDWAAKSCRDWEQHGAVVHGVLFATLHLQTLNEIAASHHGDQSKVDLYLQEIVTYGEKYLTILRHSLDTWHKHRMQQQNLNFYNAAVGGDCFIDHQGDCYAHSADHYGATIEGCPACDFCIVDKHEEPYKTRTVEWHNAWSSCHSKHRSSLQSTMNQVSEAIDGIASLKAAAQKASPPAPAPLPVFADRLHVGDVLHMGELIVSSNGWNRLLLQTDQNLVLYADNYDGYNSDAAKSTWATGAAGSGAYLKLQGDGNACLYGGGKAKWCSNTAGKGGHHLVVQNDGNLCLYPSSGAALWCSNTRTISSSIDNSSVTLV